MTVLSRCVALRALALLAPLAALSCTDAKIEPVPPPEVARADNKLAIEGSFCTTNPDDRDARSQVGRFRHLQLDAHRSLMTIVGQPRGRPCTDALHVPKLPGAGRPISRHATARD